jgi:hypothetical protein
MFESVWALTAEDIEDDYDAEFRYDRAAIGALQGLSPERVAYCGSVGKTLLSPALRIGWTVLPHKCIDEVSRQKLFDDIWAPRCSNNSHWRASSTQVDSPAIFVACVRSIAAGATPPCRRSQRRCPAWCHPVLPWSHDPRVDL